MQGALAFTFHQQSCGKSWRAQGRVTSLEGRPLGALQGGEDILPGSGSPQHCRAACHWEAPQDGSELLWQPPPSVIPVVLLVLRRAGDCESLAGQCVSRELSGRLPDTRVVRVPGEAGKAFEQGGRGSARSVSCLDGLQIFTQHGPETPESRRAAGRARVTMTQSPASTSVSQDVNQKPVLLGAFLPVRAQAGHKDRPPRRDCAGTGEALCSAEGRTAGPRAPACVPQRGPAFPRALECSLLR